MDEVKKLDNKNASYFENTNEGIVMSEKDEDHYRDKNSCRFCEKKTISADKVGGHCHLTGKYRRLAHNRCKIFVTKKEIIFIPVAFHKLSKYDCLFLIG